MGNTTDKYHIIKNLPKEITGNNSSDYPLYIVVNNTGQFVYLDTAIKPGMSVNTHNSVQNKLNILNNHLNDLLYIVVIINGKLLNVSVINYNNVNLKLFMSVIRPILEKFIRTQSIINLKKIHLVKLNSDSKIYDHLQLKNAINLNNNYVDNTGNKIVLDGKIIYFDNCDDELLVVLRN